MNLHEDGKSYHDKSCTMFMLPDLIVPPLVQWAGGIDADNIYDNDSGEYGIEKEPHVTILYGINNDDPMPVRHALVGWNKPVEMEFGPLDIFSLKDKPYDVLKVPVISPALIELHNLIKKSTDNTASFPDYHPHMTIAYLQKGVSKKYVGHEPLKGVKLVFDKLLFRTRQKDSIVIPLYMKSFKQFMEEDAAMGGGSGTGVVAANVTGDSPTMSMPPDLSRKKLLKRQANNPELSN